MREFRPPVRPSVLRVVLAIVLPLVVLVALGAVAPLAFGISAPSYAITDGALVVRSGELFSGSRTVRLADITEARVVTLQGGRRTAGTALPGYCAGRFSYPDLGAVWQVTNCTARGVLVRASGEERPLVVSPPDPQGFVALLEAGTPTTITMSPPDTGALRLIALVIVPLVFLSVLMVSAVLLLGPSRMRYLVGDGALEVRTLFGRQRWSTAGARARAYTPARLLRVAGTAAPGYYTGMFREAGQPTGVYATDTERVILFEGPRRVLVSPEDRVEMLKALEEQGVVIEKHAG